jgi:hypothetical protein
VISNIRVYRLEISIPAVSFLLSPSRAKLTNASTEAFEQTIRKNTEIELIGLWSRLGAFDSAELLRTFNWGVRMVLVVPAKHVGRVKAELKGAVRSFIWLGGSRLGAALHEWATPGTSSALSFHSEISVIGIRGSRRSKFLGEGMTGRLPLGRPGPLLGLPIVSLRDRLRSSPSFCRCQLLLLGSCTEI